jgi:hypothetical protein
MKLTRAARAILSVTALAWAIPFAQGDDRIESRDDRGTTLSLDDHRGQPDAQHAAWPFGGDANPPRG